MKPMYRTKTILVSQYVPLFNVVTGVGADAFDESPAAEVVFVSPSLLSSFLTFLFRKPPDSPASMSTCLFARSRLQKYQNASDWLLSS